MTSVYSTCFTKAYDDFVKYSEIFNAQIPCNEKIIVNENIRLRLVGEYELEKDSSLHFNKLFERSLSKYTSLFSFLY